MKRLAIAAAFGVVWTITYFLVAVALNQWAGFHVEPLLALTVGFVAGYGHYFGQGVKA